MTRIKVSVQKLIEEIEKRKLAEEQRVAVARTEFPARMEEWKQACREKIASWCAEIEQGKSPAHGYPTLPGRPSEPLSTVSRYERDIQTLRMAAEPSISLTSDDYNRYLS